MTFDDDFVRLHLSLGTTDLPLTAINLEWPPPERLFLDSSGCRVATDQDPQTEVLVCNRKSKITDKQRKDMTHVARGAEYFYNDKETGQ